MTASDWRAVLARGSGSSFSSNEFATLAECDVFYVHIDERGPSITAACEVALATNRSLEFFVVFNNVREVRVVGWSYEKANRFTLRQDAEATYLVDIVGPGTELTFQCGAVVLGSAREFAVGPE
jgi:hypothetical protein